jgi:quercetin dioxygenase-like cupin family protein
MEPIAIVPEHSHNYPQWGMVIQGKMKLTINNQTRLYKKGDEYLIPAQAKHKATFSTKAKVIDLFQEKIRYKTKQTK